VRLFAHDTKVEALKRVPLFAGLSKKELGQLARASEDLEVLPGKVLCEQGRLGREFFVIVEGEAEVTRDGKLLSRMKPGDFFGEIALLEHTPRTATVTAKTPLRFFVLTSQAFRHLVDEAPSVQTKVLQALAKRVLSLTREAEL